MDDSHEPEIIRFLRASGLAPTPDQMEQVLQFQRKADEARDLSNRLHPTYPVKRDLVALKSRWDAKDPNVACLDHGEGRVTYELHFTAEQLAQIESGYLAIRPPVEGYPPGWSHEAKVFARVVEEWADAISLFQAIAPEPQKARTRTLESVANALMKLDQSLSDLDSAALGYWYAKVADTLALDGVQISGADDRITSMQDHPLRAVVEAGELRQTIRKIIAETVSATNSAKTDLPKFDHRENDVRLTTALQLERLIIEHQIAFETKETGFAAMVLRMIFELADLHVEKVGYWLSNASKDERSHARWLQSLQNRQSD